MSPDAVPDAAADAVPDAAADAVLVYHAGALGDFVTAVPAFRAWRALHPGTRLAYLGRPAHGALGVASGLFDDLQDGGSPRYASLFRADPTPGALLEMSRFRAALVFARADSPLPGALAASGIAEVLRLDPFPPDGGPHVVDFHLAPFPRDCIPEWERVPHLRFPEAFRRRAQKLLPPGPSPTALHPGSGSPRKNWPADRWAALARGLAEEGRRVVWVLGPVEECFSTPAGAEVLRSPDLATLSCFFSLCRLFVGNDGGATHLAAASGCPVVALFGPTDPDLWAPRGASVTVLRHGDSVDSIDGFEVLAASRRAAPADGQPRPTGGR